MDAPTYPPAIAFEQPTAMPYVLRLENASLAELMAIPAAWEIVVKHHSVIKMIVSSPSMRPYLSNFTVQAASIFVKAATPEQIAAIDRELSQLPEGSKP